jgi:hypothetical protein
VGGQRAVGGIGRGGAAGGAEGGGVACIERRWRRPRGDQVVVDTRRDPILLRFLELSVEVEVVMGLDFLLSKIKSGL